MNDDRSREQFLQALQLCQSLVNFLRKPSSYPCEAIKLFCEVGKSPTRLLELVIEYEAEVIQADQAVESYARSIDNWKGEDCPFGMKDHCNILHFFLNIHTKNFQFFRGQNWTPERICEFLQEWKGIDLTSLIAKTPSTSPETKFLQALELCCSLQEMKAQFSSLPCQILELLCDVGQNPRLLYSLKFKYPREVDNALVAIDLYAQNADNWRVDNKDCSLGFGVKDHCTLLNFLLNFGEDWFSFTSYTGNFESKSIVFELLKDWKGIDLAPLEQQLELDRKQRRIEHSIIATQAAPIAYSGNDRSNTEKEIPTKGRKDHE
jgi:hypothetical protein